jgi:hypothetical protein
MSNTQPLIPTDLAALYKKISKNADKEYMILHAGMFNKRLKGGYI